MRALGRGSVASIIKLGLEITWILLWIAAGFLALAVLAYGALLLADGLGLIHAQRPLGPQGGAVRIDNIIVALGEGAQLDRRLAAPAFLAGTVAIIGALVVVGQLKQLFHNFTSGAPFSPDNAGRLRVIWITMLAVELSRYAISAFIALLLAMIGQPEHGLVKIEAPVNLTAWAMILILIVLAEVFREGARLKQEQELTI